MDIKSAGLLFTNECALSAIQLTTGSPTLDILMVQQMYIKLFITLTLSAVALSQAAADLESTEPDAVNKAVETTEEVSVDIDESVFDLDDESTEIPQFDYPHANETEVVSNETNETVPDVDESESGAMMLTSGLLSVSAGVAAVAAWLF